MSLTAIIILAFILSIDAFMVSVGKGAGLQKARTQDALRIGAIFGLVSGIAPVIGWGVGYAASNFIQEIDHWLAFGFLSLIGCKMIYESFKEISQDKDFLQGTSGVVLAAIATSIDALAVGVSLAFTQSSISIAAIYIGVITFMMVSLGVLTGHYISSRIGRIAEGLGGIGLIFIGTRILLQHSGML